jgi:hypothetical protein
MVLQAKFPTTRFFQGSILTQESSKVLKLYLDNSKVYIAAVGIYGMRKISQDTECIEMRGEEKK